MSAHLLLALLRLSGEFSVALLLVLAVRPVLRRNLGAGIAYAAWMLVPLLLLVAQLPASAPGLVLHKLVVHDGPASLSIAPMAVRNGFELLARLLLALWGLGTLAVLAVLAFRQQRFLRSLRFDAINDCWRTPVGSGPALVGVFRPRLCLPDDFEQRFTPVQQALILAHENVHRRRGDNAWNLLTAAVCALQWFNPLAWWAARAMRADQELACDEAVLRRRPDQAVDYARALLQAQGSFASLAHGLPWASWRSIHPLVERIAMLKIHAHARRRTGLAVLLTLGLLGAGGVHALRSEQPASVKDADVKLDLSLEYSETVDGKLSRWEITTTVAVQKDTDVHLHLPIERAGHDKDELELIVAASPWETGKWMVSTELRQGTPAKTVAKPRVMTADGQKATIETGQRLSTGQSLHMIRVGITPTGLHP